MSEPEGKRFSALSDEKILEALAARQGRRRATDALEKLISMFERASAMQPGLKPGISICVNLARLYKQAILPDGTFGQVALAGLVKTPQATKAPCAREPMPDVKPQEISPIKPPIPTCADIKLKNKLTRGRKQGASATLRAMAFIYDEFQPSHQPFSILSILMLGNASDPRDGFMKRHDIANALGWLYNNGHLERTNYGQYIFKKETLSNGTIGDIPRATSPAQPVGVGGGGTEQIRKGSLLPVSTRRGAEHLVGVSRAPDDESSE